MTIKKRNKLLLDIVLLVSILGLAFYTLIAVVTPGANTSSLLFPKLALAAPPSQLPPTFDNVMAGISAYVNTGGQIDIGLLRDLGIPLQTGDNHLVLDLVDAKAILYAEKSGWLVAYLPRGEVVSKITKWSEQGQNFKPVLSGDNILSQTLEAAVVSLGLDWNAYRAHVGYTHWGFPSASRLVIFSKGTFGVDDAVKFRIPSTTTLYEASWSWIASEQNCGTTRFVLYYGSSSSVFDCSGLGAGKFSNNQLTIGTEQTISLSPRSTTHWLGVAVYLVMK